MLYILALFCPPLAVLLSGKPFSAIGNCILMIIGFMTLGAGWLVAFVHAVAVVHGVRNARKS